MHENIFSFILRNIKKSPVLLIAVVIAVVFSVHFAKVGGAGSTDLPNITNFTPVIDSGCSGCSAVFNSSTSTLTATIAGGADNLDTAYGLSDFGGSTGWSGRTYSRTYLGFPSAQAINANLAVFQVRDTGDKLIYELYVSNADRTLRLWSPSGGLRSSSINSSTGVVVPAGSTIRAEVSALKNNSVVVQVNGTTKINLTGLTGANTGNARYIRAGIDHYDTNTTAETVRFAHTNVGITTLGWLGTRTGSTATAPANTTLPVISGNATAGSTLTSSSGSWSGTTPISYTYQWLRCDNAGNNCADIASATSSSYSVASNDQGYTLRAKVTASNSAGSSSASSAATAVVTAPPVNNSLPVISGNTVDGQTLTATTGSWTATPLPVYTYQWQSCDSTGNNCVNIFGATGSSYTLQAADVGNTIRIVVTASNSVGSSSATSVQTSVVVELVFPPQNTSLPAITGTTQEGETLLASTGTWTNSPTGYTYQWQDCDSAGANCAVINGATSSSYTLMTSDVGHTIVVAVTASNGGGSTIANSLPTAVVAPIPPPVNTSLPLISGSTQQGQTLSASTGSWSNSPTSYTYQWLNCDSAGNNCVNIINAAAATYTLQASDVGDTIRVQVTATNNTGSASATSAQTAVISGVPPSNTTTPAIFGSAFVGQTLSVSNGAWVGTTPITYAYQWQRCSSSGTNCQDISAATAANYVITSADIGSVLQAKVTASNNYGSASAVSNQTAVVTDPSSTDLPNITNFTPVIDSGCSGCSAVFNSSTSTLTATIAGGADNLDTAYGLSDFGGSTGWSGRTYSRTYLGFPSTQAINDNLAVFQMRDVNDKLIYELYVAGSDGTLDLWSPSGGLRSSSINLSTGIVVPKGSTIRVEVSALKNNSVTVRVDGVGMINLTGLTGATTGNARYLRAGIDHYDTSTTAETVRFAHTNVGITTLDWLGTRTGVAAAAPTNNTLPVIAGSTQVGGALAVSTGNWSGTTPMSFSYQWQRCDSAGNNCTAISGATSSSYTATSADQNLTLRASVTAANSVGSATAVSNPSALITASSPGYQFTRNLVDPTGGQCSGCETDSLGVGDINNDGRVDMVVGGESALLWYENSNNGAGWTPHTIASGTYGAGARVIVRDMNNDGLLDIITGETTSTRQMVWFENTGTGWIRHLLTSAAYCHDIVFGDINNDGRADAACADQRNIQVAWLQAPADPTTQWPVNLIEARDTMGGALADIDKDGSLDFVTGRAWYRNPGNGNGTWTRYAYTTMTNAQYPDFNDYEEISLVDLNGDGRLDIFATLFAESPTGQVWTFLSPADPLTGSWTPVQVDTNTVFAVHSQIVAPFDGTGTPQIMVGESNYGGWDFGQNPDPQIYIYRLLGPAMDSVSWQRSLVDSHGTHEAQVADFNNDGKLDIAGHDENTGLMTPPQNGSVYWWANNYTP